MRIVIWKPVFSFKILLTADLITTQGPILIIVGGIKPQNDKFANNSEV
jgi:hypothetical protein